MRLMLLPLFAFTLCSCGATGPFPRAPAARLADEIEAKLSKVGCIGSMSHWERRYSFSSRPSWLATILTLGRSNLWFNYNSVEIDYRQAGFEEFRPRRILYAGRRPFDVDDRNYDLVFGHYDVPAHTGFIWACGLNLGGGDSDPDHPRIIVR